MPSNSLAMWDAWILQASDEELAMLGLYPGDDATYMAEVMGSDAYTWENVIVSQVYCLDEEMEEAATSLVAASAAILAVALLN